ncbi:MAG: 3-oxoacyl-ACP synthase III [Nannocystales bacterium]
MNYDNVYVHGFGYALAPVIVATEDLEDELAPAYAKLRVPPGQLESMTGIVERRWWEPGYPVTEGAILAAQRCLDAHDVPAADIGMLVYGAVCREHFEPATACHVAAGLEARGHAISPSAAVFDVSNACLGVVTGIVEVANRIALGQIEAGLVVACETAREINEATIARLNADPTMARYVRSVATFTGGSGAIAVLVTGTRYGGHQLHGVATRAAPAHHRLCRWGLEPHPDASAPDNDPALRPFAATDASGVLEHGVTLGRETWSDFLETTGWSSTDVDRTVCHQIGAAHRNTMLSTLQRDPSADFAAYEYLGNIGTVALPLATALAGERDFLLPGHRVGLLGIGSGLNCMMLGVTW